MAKDVTCGTTFLFLLTLWRFVCGIVILAVAIGPYLTEYGDIMDNPVDYKWWEVTFYHLTIGATVFVGLSILAAFPDFILSFSTTNTKKSTFSTLVDMGALVIYIWEWTLFDKYISHLSPDSLIYKTAVLYLIYLGVIYGFGCIGLAMFIIGGCLLCILPTSTQGQHAQTKKAHLSSIVTINDKKIVTKESPSLQKKFTSTSPQPNYKTFDLILETSTKI